MSEQQLFFPFSNTPSYTLADFFVSSSNHEAFECIRKWPNWPSLGMVILGPTGSGKTHLAHIWQQSSGARFFDQTIWSSTLENFQVDQNTPLIFDEQFPEDTDFFHLLNMLKDSELPFLILKKKPFNQDQIHLKDLRSRLLNIPSVTLHAPNDDLIKAMILKQCADAQIMISDPILNYITTHMDRSYESIARLCKKLIHEIQGQRHNLTLPLVKSVMEA